MNQSRSQSPESASRWRRAISRLAADGDGTTDESDMPRGVERGGASDTIRQAPDRERVTIEGTLHTVTLRPRGGVPALEAELADDSGRLTLVFLGRRRITGVTPGRGMRVTGRIGIHHDQRIMYNPRYELLPTDPDRVFR